MRTTFARNSSAAAWSAEGVIQTYSDDTPRIDHDPLDGATLGRLISGQITSYASDVFKSWTPLRNNSVLSEGGLSPDGVTPMRRVAPGQNGDAGIVGSFPSSPVDSVIVVAYIRPLAVTRIRMQEVTNLAFNVVADLATGSAPDNVEIMPLASGIYRVSVWSDVSNFGKSSFTAAGSASLDQPAFEVWGICAYSAQNGRRIDPLPAQSNATTVAADLFDAPAGDWLPSGRHTWRGSVRMSADPGEPTIIGHPEGRIYAFNGRLSLDGPGTLWQPDGEHAPGDIVPFYWETKFAAAPDFTLGRAFGDFDWWNSHLIDIVPYPRVISETDIREALGL